MDERSIERSERHSEPTGRHGGESSGGTVYFDNSWLPAERPESYEADPSYVGDGRYGPGWTPSSAPTAEVAYSFRTASGERLDFTSDGTRVNATRRSGSNDVEAGGDARLHSPSRARRGGTHRLPAPPPAIKGRAAVVAVAAGAVVAAGQAGVVESAPHTHAADYEADGQIHTIAAQALAIPDASLPGSGSPQMVVATSPTDLGQFSDILERGQKFAQELAVSATENLPPLWTKFAEGTLTSGFGARWGAVHTGVDVAGIYGSPILAVADATVIDAGPASGFGMWVRLRHDDGTISVYGHIDSATVQVGQRVTAGDQIARMGNSGISTGTHVHFEVWRNGVDKIDPIPWLASRGISLGPERD
ncbi:M23 family metallopeptidase [Nocardia sp. NBC_01388]|uniref:M23 family metallopeptidase n=1 Tax=Nocardia sp. NBC_01388 TaxID=2903596 RepID=UPI003247DE2D